MHVYSKVSESIHLGDGECAMYCNVGLGQRDAAARRRWKQTSDSGGRTRVSQTGSRPGARVFLLLVFHSWVRCLQTGRINSRQYRHNYIACMCWSLLHYVSCSASLALVCWMCTEYTLCTLNGLLANERKACVMLRNKLIKNHLASMEWRWAVHADLQLPLWLTTLLMCGTFV